MKENAKDCKVEELRPEFIKEIQHVCMHGKFVKVKNFKQEFDV